MQVLLRMDSVQHELQMTDDQKKQQDEVFQKARQKIQQSRRNLESQAEFMKARDAVLQEVEAAFLATFKPAQRERLDQIQLQAQGPMAFVRAESAPGLRRPSAGQETQSLERSNRSYPEDR